MKKSLFKFTSALLALACVGGTAFGCNQTGVGSNGESEVIDEIGAYDGLHVYEKTVRQGEWLVKDGKTDYQLVLPESTLSRRW